MQPIARLSRIATGLACCAGAWAEPDVERAHIAVVGTVDRFNIGQDGYCGKRTFIEESSPVSFQVPAGKRTWAYVRMGGTFSGKCTMDFSFVPEPGHLHIIRFVPVPGGCRLEMFRTLPGGTPRPAAFQREASRSCLIG